MDNHNNRYNNVVLRPGISGVKHSTMMKATRGNLRNLTNSAWTQRDWLSRAINSSDAFRSTDRSITTTDFITSPFGRN